MVIILSEYNVEYLKIVVSSWNSNSQMIKISQCVRS